MWIVPLLLVGLALIGGLIVLIAWIIFQPAPVTISAHRGVDLFDQPVIAVKNHQNQEPVIDEEPIDLATRTMPAMPRRMPSPEPEWPCLQPMPLAEPSALIAPAEVARKVTTPILYLVRRPEKTETASSLLRLAVTPVVHDDLGSVLTSMGDGYRFTKLRNEDLLSFDALKKHDVVFLTCADLYVKDFQAAPALRKFVANGGTLYASDLRGDLLQAAFPEFRARVPVLPGVPQRIETNVVESGLQSYLGRKAIPLQFDAPDWRPAPFDAKKVTVLLHGMYRNNLGQAQTAPLLVKFRFEKGTVIFTSFHHVKNDSATVRKLIEYLIYASVNTRGEASIQELIRQPPRETRPALVNAESGIDAVFHHSSGPLQVALAFENLGAQFRLTLRAPNGQVIEHIDGNLFAIDLPEAEAGTWRYTITPLALPYANFPVTLLIGVSKSQ